MRIITKGKFPEDKEYKHTCSNCQTIFVFQKKEVKIIYDRDQSFYSCLCPFCNKTTYISKLEPYHSPTIDPY